MRCLYARLTREEADAFTLVLASAGIGALQVHDAAVEWSIWVADQHHEAARSSIEQYRRENPVRPPFETPVRPLAPRSYTAVWVSLVLVAVYLAAGSGEAFDRMAGWCGASAEAILDGQLYRAATALMLHATPAHLAGNVAGLALFGTAVGRVTGAGLGWSMIVLSGVAGNIANAVFFQSGHLSVGASTAVFGAVGLSAAFQFHHHGRTAGLRRFKAWLPLAGGLALLGMLGAGAHTDLTAHLFGFAAGILIGLGYARRVRTPPGEGPQAFALALTVVLLTGCWVWAYFAR